MKNLLVFVTLFVSGIAIAQDFEGTVKWSMKMEITDPKQKAQMEQAQKAMSDPAQQAKMKEMQEQMNDPQMKAMMESNPQMKAQMERMMASMQSGNMNSIMPSGMTVKIKNQNTLTKIEGGMFSGEILYLKDKSQTYTINRDSKTYSVVASAQPESKPEQKPEVKVTKTSETVKILNHMCTKYQVDVTDHGKKITQFVWATTEIKDFDFKALAKQRMARGHQMFYGEIDGVPLKMEMKTPDANMTMEVLDIKRESLTASDFTIPADFKEVKGMGPMGH